MLFKASVAVLLLHILGAVATWTAYEEYLANLPSKAEAKRPKITFEPNQPWKPLPDSPPRHKTCEVKSHNDLQTDDSKYILNALRKCNNGGKVLFPRGQTYVIGKALNMQFLEHVDLGT